MNTKLLIIKIALRLSVIAMIAFSVDALAQPTQVSITAPASDGTTAKQGGMVTFTGTATDPDSLTLTYTWNFSDGTSQTGQTVNYQMPADATVGSTITATLNVTNFANVLADTHPTRSVTVSAASASSNFIYVTQYFSNTVTLIDLTSDEKVATLTVNNPFFGQDVSWDGKYVYLVYTKDGVSNGVVSVMDKDTHTVTARADVNNGAYAVAVTPDGKFAYATNFDVYGTVTVTDTATNLVVSTVTVGSYPLGISITPDGTSAYVANYLDGTVSVIDIASKTVSKTIAVAPNLFRVGSILSTPAVPFSAFNVENLSVAPLFGALSLVSNFTLADNSVGIAPTLQTTTLNIGRFILVIPPGAFVQDGWWPGSYRFTGTFQGMYVNALLQALSEKQFSLQVYAYHANFFGLKNPVTVQLSIGGEKGIIPSATVNIVR
ncbi:MAG: PKD domain-containing protein [Proteobacteria bacterium]|nr:PKD domain-containing protein [Pseudomonadota bacterium]